MVKILRRRRRGSPGLCHLRRAKVNKVLKMKRKHELDIGEPENTEQNIMDRNMKGKLRQL